MHFELIGQYIWLDAANEGGRREKYDPQVSGLGNGVDF